MTNVFLKWGNAQAFYFLILIAIFVAVYFVFEKYFSLKLNKAFGKKVSDYLTQSLSLPMRIKK